MMSLFATNFIFWFFFIASFPLIKTLMVIQEETAAGKKSDDDFYLNAMQTIRKFDYPAEGYTIKTKDGYLLEMHRIPHGKNEHFSQRGPPALIQHGLFSSSGDFLWVGPEKGLPFILADKGYDVWMGNFRGNSYSRAHVNLNPKNDEFWNFTWHETGLYDVSAQIDFIIGHTAYKRIFYVGHSMGSTAFFVLMSEIPEYNSKVEASFLLAPIAYMKNVYSFLLRFLASSASSIRFFDIYCGKKEFPPNEKLWNALTNLVCKRFAVESRLCMFPAYLLAGADPENYEKNVTNELFAEFPNSFSVKGIIHYLQLIKSGKFRQYDYGSKQNLRIYGSPEPPEYNLKNIETPLHFYLGMNDWLATVPNVFKLTHYLSSLKSSYIAVDKSFNHLDFFASTKAKAQIYDFLLKDLFQYK